MIVRFILSLHGLNQARQPAGFSRRLAHPCITLPLCPLPPLHLMSAPPQVTFAMRLLANAEDEKVDPVTSSYHKLACELKHLEESNQVGQPPLFLCCLPAYLSFFGACCDFPSKVDLQHFGAWAGGGSDQALRGNYHGTHRRPHPLLPSS